MKKKSNKKTTPVKRKKYTVGGKVNSYVQDPSDMLAENQIMIAQAQLEAATDPFLQSLKGLSAVLGMAGNQFISMGGKPGGGGGGSSSSDSLSASDIAPDILDIDSGGIFQARYGGKVPPPPSKRTSERKNKDGTHSTHLYVSGESDGKFVVYPTIYQNDKGEYYEAKDAFREAIKKGELLEFDTDEEAKSYAKGSWKNYYNYDGSKLEKKRYGGKVNVPVEVEGGEVAETPDGQLIDFKGPSHEKGGIDVNLPPGTDIFSEVIKIDGESLAQRKKKRDKKIDKFAKEEDFIGQTSMKRAIKSGQVGDQLDKTVQSIFSIIEKQEELDTVRKKYVFGVDGLEDGINYNDSYTGEEIDYTGLKTNKNKKSSNSVGITPGDFLGVAGNVYQSVAPYINTLRSRAESRPNINPYEGFGDDALKANTEAGEYIQGILDNQMQDIELSTTGARKNLRGSARGVNTMRALDVATEGNKQKAVRGAYNDYASRMLSNLTQKSQLENIQDQHVMQGKGMKDIADRQDQGVYLTNIGQDKMNMGRGLSEMGKFLNKSKERDVMATLMNSIFEYTGMDFGTGDMQGKDNAGTLAENGGWKFATDNPNTTDGKYRSLQEFRIVKGLDKKPKKTKK